MTQITHVAVIFDGITYSLPKPNRHHHVLQMMSKDGIRLYGPHQEGFLDETGRFLSRRGAYALACETGQINRRKGKEFYQGNELYSEDLW